MLREYFIAFVREDRYRKLAVFGRMKFRHVFARATSLDK